MEAYIARQPIFNRDKSLFGYELLFRDSMANFVPDVDGDMATTQLLSSSFFTMGIEKITGNTKALINFTENLLLQQIPEIFPAEFTVVEILEDVEPTPEVIAACQLLKDKGYMIALDDFISRPEMEPLVDLADIIKIDFRAVPMDEMADYVKPLQEKDLVLLAEKVESYSEFHQALEIGFALFQGYFFCKPEVVRGKEISSSQINVMDVLKEVNRPEVDYEKVCAILERDVALSYKLLHYVNSAFYRRAQEITSINQALVVLGQTEIRRFVSMISLAHLVSDKPHELVKLSFVRAKFLDSISSQLPNGQSDSKLFTVGLFSMIDAILDQPMPEIMGKLPLSSEIVDALVDQIGILSDCLKLVVAYETGEWSECSRIAQVLGLAEETMPELYAEACQWGSELSSN